MRKVIQHEEFPFVSGFCFRKIRCAIKSDRESESILARQLPRITRQWLRGPSERLVHRFLDHRLLPLPPVNLDAVGRDKLDRDDALACIRPEKNGIVFDGGERRRFSHG
jgi:hypothetical protein